MIRLMSTHKLRADESEVFFRTLLDSAPDAMIIVDDAGRIAIVNGQAEQMFGYERDEMLGNTIEFLLPERFREAHVSHRDNFLSSASIRPMGVGRELAGRRKDGSEFPVEISLSPVPTGGGTFVHSVIRDVTKRKRMEAEIIAAQQEAERANKANSAFLAAASHDLRQPVQALSLLNGALRRTVKDERALEMIEYQENSLTAMTNLLNSLLDISRLDAGAITPEFEVFPLQRLMDRLSAEFSRQAQHKGLEFDAVSCEAVVRSDPNLLSEIIQNLVSNAIRYTDKGKVSLTCVETNGECYIAVTDTGIGIEADQLEEIFREFHQCTVPGASKEGFGLGLAIVRRLADLLGHVVEVASEPGKGSKFSVCIPVAEAKLQATDADLSVAVDQSQGFGFVILIEDDVSVANAWSLLLEAEGYQVALAASATEARALVAHLEATPSLLISDFHLLDGSTGVEAVTEIRKYYDTNIPAFIVSGDTSKVVKDARPVENSTLMSKPVSTERLLAAARIATRTGKVPQD
jgi:PAS domain S-box-containing protein